MRFNPATAPGINRWEAVQPSQVSAGWSSPRQGLEVRTEVVWAQSQPRESYSSYMPLNSDPRLRREHTGMYVAGAQQTGGTKQPGRAEATPQLGAALNRGYGRAPTAFVYTSADTLLSTTSYQSHAAAAAAPAPQQQRLQAYAFTCADGSTGAWARSSASAPASPLGQRTLLYTRAVGTQQPQAAAADLLDRLTLLRRLAPTTGPATRPQQLTAAAQHFTPAAPALRADARAAPNGGPTAAGSSGCRRWAWDDSLVGCSSAARPIAFTPAVGWRYCGDVAAVGPAAGWEAGAPASAAVGGRGVTINLALAGGGGGGGSWDLQQHQQQQGEEGEVVLVVRSPRPHRLHEEDDAAAAWDEAAGGLTDGSGGARCSSCGGGRGAFRPPGPLQHKFGNKPPPGRPNSAPSAAERARAAGLRECGCPRSPRHPWYPNSTGRSAGGGARQTHGSGSATARGRQRVAWQDEEAVAVITSRPRSAAAAEALAACRQPPRSPAATAAQGMMSSRPSSPYVQPAAHMPQSRGRDNGWGVSGGAGGAAPTTTTTVSVSTPAGDTDVVVVSSPRAAGGSGLGPAEHEVLVVASSPRARARCPRRGGADHSGGSSDLLYLHHETHAASPPPPRPRQPAATPASPRVECQQREGRNKLTVSMPAGAGGGSFQITADASSAGAAAAAGGGSPIKAWRQAPAPDAPSSAPAWPQQQQEWARAGPASPPAQGRAPAADLERLESEVKRREKSFGQLLSELDRISAKCAQLTSGNSGGSGAKHGGSTTRNSSNTTAAGAAAGAAAAPASAARQAHTTHRFESGSTPARAGGGGSSYAGGRGSTAGAATAPAAAQADREDWGWENLLAFEEKIRKQQRKLVEQGVLPPEYQ